MTMLNTVAERLPAWFVATEIGRSLVAQHEREEHAARQTLVDQLDAKRRDLPLTCDKHARIIEPLDAAARAARAKWETAETALRQAQGARHEAIHAIERRIGDLERDLTSAADPRIDAAKWSMLKKWEETRYTIARSQEVPTGRFNNFTNAPAMRLVSNTAAIERLSAAMAAARVAFDELKLRNPDDLDRAIAAVLSPVNEAWAQVTELDAADGPQAA